MLLLSPIFADPSEGLPPIELDEIAPVITLLGDAVVHIEEGGIYVDAGATAEDNIDKHITERIVVTGLPVDTTVIGPHTIAYNVSDAAGNAADEVTRIVRVFPKMIEPPVPPVDEVAPVITLLGDATVNVTLGETYTDAGVTATDDVDGDITDVVITVNPVDTTTVGTYTITYNVKDRAGNGAIEVTRTVNVIAPATTGGGGGRRIRPTPVTEVVEPAEAPVQETPVVSEPVVEQPQPVPENTNAGNGETLTPVVETPIETTQLEETPIAETPSPSGLTGFAGFASSPGGVVTIIGGILVVIGAVGYFFFLRPR